jgi:hypothetical protein
VSSDVPSQQVKARKISPPQKVSQKRIAAMTQNQKSHANGQQLIASKQMKRLTAKDRKY